MKLKLTKENCPEYVNPRGLFHKYLEPRDIYDHFFAGDRGYLIGGRRCGKTTSLATFAAVSMSLGHTVLVIINLSLVLPYEDYFIGMVRDELLKCGVKDPQYLIRRNLVIDSLTKGARTSNRTKGRTFDRVLSEVAEIDNALNAPLLYTSSLTKDYTYHAMIDCEGNSFQDIEENYQKIRPLYRVVNNKLRSLTNNCPDVSVGYYPEIESAHNVVSDYYTVVT